MTESPKPSALAATREAEPMIDLIDRLMRAEDMASDGASVHLGAKALDAFESRDNAVRLAFLAEFEAAVGAALCEGKPLLQALLNCADDARAKYSARTP